MRTTGWALVLAGLMGAGAGPAEGHVTNVSRSQLVVEGARVRYRLEMRPLDLAVGAKIIADPGEPLTQAAFGANEARMIRYLQERVLVFGDGQSCEPGPARLDLSAFPEGTAVSWVFTCPEPFQKLLLQYLVFTEVDPHHATVGRLVAGGGVSDFTLGADHPEFEISLGALEEGAPEQAWRFFLLGIQHILIGYDHILFLLGLIVASLRWGYLLTVITMFTVAHTVTLLLAAFGWVRLPGPLVESVIALSIAYVAFENLGGWGLRWRWAVTFGFGLVHGLGFAAVLAELTRGGETHVASLFTFNLGVEAGQLLIVGAVLPVLLLLNRYRLHARVMQFASLGILVIALYWFGERAIWG
jgi:hypothetical protein